MGRNILFPLILKLFGRISSLKKGAIGNLGSKYDLKMELGRISSCREIYTMMFNNGKE